jgi:protein-S-isoprenylcysteine O-methyltransferase Ste14
MSVASVSAPASLIRWAVLALWVLWIVSWFVAAAWQAPVQKRPGIGAQLVDRILVLVGAVLLFWVPPSSALAMTTPLLAYPSPVAWTLVGLVAVGFVFAWWARIHLGRLWSGGVTQKQDHKIVDSGPYGLVRHPIYTGVLMSAWASAALEATPLGFIGAALMTLGFYVKARLEERFLSDDLGPEYEAYRRRVPMLVPGVGA